MSEFNKEKNYPVFSVGPDTMSEYDFQEIPDDYEWLIYYYYSNGGYDGSGIALAKKGDILFWENLGHCSCYGPANAWKPDVFSVNSARRSFEEVSIPGDYDYEYWKLVIAKAKELLGLEDIT